MQQHFVVRCAKHNTVLYFTTRMFANSPNLPPEISAAFREAKARGLPDGWSCQIDKRNRRKWTSPNGRSCDSIPKALVISVELGLLPPDTQIVHGHRKKKRRPVARARSDSSRSAKRAKAVSSYGDTDEEDEEEEEDGEDINEKPESLEKKEEKRIKKEEKDKADTPVKRPVGRPRIRPLETPVEKEAAKSTTKTQNAANVKDDDDGADDNSSLEEPTEPLDPERSLDPPLSSGQTGKPTTVHWDPENSDGCRIGWKVKVALAGDTWVEGRVVLYDPHSHQHKIEFVQDQGGGTGSAWIWLRNEEHNLQLATRIVWAHVKGYAWWPALIMESNVPEDRREGYVLAEFFGTGEISTLRDSSECVRPFSPHELDPVVAKHKKKRNAKAWQLACQECHLMRRVRNQAALWYATKSIGMANSKGTGLIGKRVQVFRSDVNYPYGDTVTAKVKQYSTVQKKWLLTFDFSERTRMKHDAAWINLQAKDVAMKVLDKKTQTTITDEDLVPYLFGFQWDEASEGDSERDQVIATMLKDRCRGCVEHWKKDEYRIVCEKCNSAFHLACFDPPHTIESWQRLVKDQAPILCSRCVTCRGCFQKDIVFGSHLYPIPTSLTFPHGESLDLCSMCKDAFDDERYCPNCAHSWDDVRFMTVRNQVDWMGRERRRRYKDVQSLKDTEIPLVLGYFSDDNNLPHGAKVDVSYYYAETSEWGYREDQMLKCDKCLVWVHAGCAGIYEDEYDLIGQGQHEIYSKEFLCRKCCRQRCREIIMQLKNEDVTGLFATPVTDKMAPTYYDVIKEPMDLSTMLERAHKDEYLNYCWSSRIWSEANRFYHTSIQSVFNKYGKAALPSKYEKNIIKNLNDAEEAEKNEQDRVQVDDSVEKKDLVAGSLSTEIQLPDLRDKPPDQPSCVPYAEVKIKSVDAFYVAWLDCCFTCGSCGAADTMLMCVDCGEAFHSFCVNAPIHSMDLASVAGWRCPNCKICEISGDVPQDDTRMLFCDMCDRAFSLDLLEPPLNSAPKGVWICGQCVDCKHCRNKFDTNGISLKYWSRSPDKCFRCGGCHGLVDEIYTKTRCGVCDVILRPDDSNVLDCCSCNLKVHTQCDRRASDYVKAQHLVTRAQKMENTYTCPSCFVPDANVEFSPCIKEDHTFLRDLAWKVVNDSNIGTSSGGTISREEYYNKLIDEIDMNVREQWRDEYVAVIRDAVRLAELATTHFGDSRIVSQHVFGGAIDLPHVMGQRALRFIIIARKLNWNIDELSRGKITKISALAKLAASFIEVASQSLGLDPRLSVAVYDRVEMLLEAADLADTMYLPPDPIRASHNMSEEELLLISTSPEEFNTFNDEQHKLESNSTRSDIQATGFSGSTLADTLCGWGKDSGPTDWKDPRECCLCKLCGDDDAGLHEYVPLLDQSTEKSGFPKLGRLLPMSDGFWIHTSCALWSSEVWESPDDGVIHAADKAKSRGSMLKCFGCGKNGATVGCNKGNCNYNYHFPCAKYCGAVFTSKQHMFCANHKSFATNLLLKESFEIMKTVIIAPEAKASIDKDSTDNVESDLCSRVGAIIVHSLGKIDDKSDQFHSENYITPAGYFATRIFWSTVKPRTRTTYMMQISKTLDEKIEFTIIPGDCPDASISSNSVSQVYGTLMDRVRKVNAKFFSINDMFSKLPTVRRTRRNTFGLNGAQFFGFGLNHVRKSLESLPGVEAVLSLPFLNSVKYRFCFTKPTIESVLDMQRRRAAAQSEQALENLSGCARTEGIKAIARSGGSGRITRALVRSAVEMEASVTIAMTKKEEEKARSDRNIIQTKYRRMKAVPIEQRLVVRRSHIHGWGLFTKIDVSKDDPIVEYMGEVVRQSIADTRERAYEVSGEGSCYMFRLDRHRIVDATMIGCMARFMNHSCSPNVEAKIISVDVEGEQEKKIVVFAKRNISAGEEITYVYKDYKFPVENGSLRCTCGAPNCIGRLN